MHVTAIGYVRTRPHILDSLREEAAHTRTHRQFMETAIAAFEQDGPDTEPLLDACPQHTARQIFDEVAEAYDRADRAQRDAAGTTTVVRDVTLPHTSHRRDQARRAEHEHHIRYARGLNRLRTRLTIG
ncbi:hypothetical protein [Streptomyces lydicus]|uniref:hypothetical protein n=1 Tax=Streptomyces lydicus TaxID=47763 RepID=UPI0010138860|nr:hypothetical protein [Streptomyces lydicus]MCZ1012033.1 hypothetical protein [Streptomyces lydicus]